VSLVVTRQYDYAPPTLEDPGLAPAFRSLQITDPRRVAWPWFRQDSPHIWRTDNRASKPLIGVLSHEEALLLHNLALRCKGLPALEIGCHLAWSTAHLVAAGLELDVIDPALGDDAHFNAVSESLAAAARLRGAANGHARLHAGFSPGIVATVAQARGTPWSFAFIDGNHDGQAPARDAEAVLPYLADDAIVVFHDLISPFVRAGWEVYRQAGWNTRIWNTTQGMGVAWRGDVTIPDHVEDPNMPAFSEAQAAALRRESESGARPAPSPAKGAQPARERARMGWRAGLSTRKLNKSLTSLESAARAAGRRLFDAVIGSKPSRKEARRRRKDIRRIAAYEKILAQPDQPTTGRTALLTALHSDIAARIESGVLGDMVARAGALEPLVHRGGNGLIVPPFLSDTMCQQIAAMRELQRLAGFRRARAVVVIPHCRAMSGAARVAGHLTTALSALYGVGEVIVLRTDLSDMDRSDWFPESSRHVDFAAVVQRFLTSPAKKKLLRRRKNPTLMLREAESLLVNFIRSLRPETVINVNSRLMWDITPIYGTALAQCTKLCAYMFCNDRNDRGHETGYPVEFFYRTFSDFHAVIVDSETLGDELRIRHRLAPQQTNKLVVLRTPIVGLPAPVARPARKPGRRPAIFWAGRFDRQKRVDIVFALAARLPAIDFFMWGKPLLTRGFDPASAPANVKLMGLYEEFAELPMHECDLWLYTSQWDGVPTILLDVIGAAVPIVASTSGGSSEVLLEGMCHRIGDVEDVNAFEAAILAVLQDPEAAHARALQLRNEMIARRTVAAYRTGLETALNGTRSNERA